MKAALAIITFILFFGCSEQEGRIPLSNDDNAQAKPSDSIPRSTHAISTTESKETTPLAVPAGITKINTGSTTPEELVTYAQTLFGIPYKYASTNPDNGFDCSGFITYVFNHFKIAVPRSSVDFTNVEREISLSEAKPGDIILFTGTDSTIRVVGHMGIVTANNNGQVEFIHSSSGKANGVTVTPLNKYYSGRFVKVLRIFTQNDAN